MISALYSKKFILSVLGIVAVCIVALLSRDLELVKWVGGFVAGIVSSMNLGQGLADGLSRGNTSAATVAVVNRSQLQTQPIIDDLAK